MKLLLAHTFLVGYATLFPCLPACAQGRIVNNRVTSTGVAPAAKPSEDVELAALKDESDKFVATFNRGDAKAIASFWTETGEYIDDQGQRFIGREQIEKKYADQFASNPGAKLRLAVTSVRLIGPEAAVEEGTAVLEPAPKVALGVSQYTAFHVKVAGKWMMASVRDRWEEFPAAKQVAADLEWLVGTWVVEEHGVRVESVIAWAIGGRFLERRYTKTAVDGTTTNGLQIIGWNPAQGRVVSWDFSPDGGHVVGVWTPTAKGWQAEMAGYTGDGLPVTAVNLMTRLDDNAYAWQSIRRTVGENALPDTPELVLKRSKPAK